MRGPALPPIVTKRDEQILLMLAKVRYATRLDVAYWCFTPGSETYAGARLRRLSGEGGVLVSFRLPTTRGNPEKIFALSGRGAALVRSLGAPEAASLRPAKLTSHISYSHLFHALALTRFLTCAEAASRGLSGLRLLEARLSYQLAGTAGLTVIPDGWLLCEKESKKYALWIEIHTGSEFFKRVAKLLEARLAFIRSGEYERVFHTRSVLICYIVIAPSPDASEARRQTLAGWTKQILSGLKLESWASIFRFVSAERKTLLATPFWTEAIWYRPDSEAPVCLFRP